MDERLPAHLEVNGLIRAVEAAGGFATVLAKGERDAGTILLVTIDRGEGAALFERMPRADGSRPFVAAKRQNKENPQGFEEYLARRRAQDRDCWQIELDVPDGERFIASWNG
ncbi:DUF1491 family protein [Altererythrobacter sp. H2]|uniref:DUF1491 family protein n=1 Tax=Altererythrobacter sp. H2 TaxID=3108391 RepID=UPI000BC83D06|nr:DUF1491 family protein [Altererythrobacter sp. H2]OZA94011.1 MAG: hypothetical protein B7X57_03055 [Erythrobacter sp. 34-65-8]WRK96063.1 DUF1491 family protein [Altererythrobacter sp. H2]